MKEFREEWDYFLDDMLSDHTSAFRQTAEGRLLREKRKKLDEDCEMFLDTTQWELVQESFAELLDLCGREEAYAYRRGLRDCVFLLKELGVLA